MAEEITLTFGLADVVVEPAKPVTVMSDAMPTDTAISA